MISLFTGAFLSSPRPLELSFNYCSHSCAFCFANLNEPSRTVDIKKIMGQLQRYLDSPTLVSHLLREKYPIFVSNRVDPFAKSNYKQAVPVLRTLTELELPYAIASRGGDGIDEVLAFAPRLIWYLSINQDNEDRRKAIEPGGTTIAGRVKLCERLAKRGDVIHFAVNPYVPEWWDDFPAFAQAMRDAGATGTYIQRLHLNSRQVHNMTNKEKTAMGPAAMKQAGNFKNYDFQLIRDAVSVLRSAGFSQVTAPDLSEYSELNRDDMAVYGKAFPTNTDLVDWAASSLPSERPVFSFAQYRDFFASRLPRGRFHLHDYLGATARQFFLTHTFSSGSFSDLLQIIWDNPEMGRSPSNLPCFAFAGEDTPEKVVYYDSENHPLLVYSSAGFPAKGSIAPSRQYFSTFSPMEVAA